MVGPTRHKQSALFRAKKAKVKEPKMQDGDKDWLHECDNCGAVPTVYPTGLCGPCCFGEANTAGGNW